MPTTTPRVSLPERFEILNHVANGGMASVWSAQDKVLGRTVAVKLLAEQFLDDAPAKARFMREARAAAALSSHPHVVTIFDVGEHDGRPYIVMEYLAGGSVAD
ncbi:MAG: eukaryotic-like serine/threonine-protein kinase, partial [Solirubrobacteraceae bacterium]|nr:eukaryotic-like serine/threonine-protein kinase [Solirubrobacteraceae bacterium]